jgi:hypothetical protein
MMTFKEYIARREGGDPLGTPAEMLAKMGVSPGVPHDVVVKRMLKREKRRDALGKVLGGSAEPQPGAGRS